ncbi:MAG: putative phosphodiesterase [Candidatus Brocadia sinica]|nr:MAG: putative phosphodiesterase [Candidatus Brocadia sinica]
MKIGILADTHDNIAAIHKAVSFFNAQDIKYVIHAGDYVAPFSLKELMKLKAKFIGVFGNNDGERRGLSDVCKNIHEPPYDLLLNGKHIMVTHMLESLSKRSKKIQISLSAPIRMSLRLKRGALCMSILVSAARGYLERVPLQC